MEIEINDRRLKSALEDESVCQRRFGMVMAKHLRLRVSALYAAKCLLDFWPPKTKPERVHELLGNLDGIFSVDLKQPYRLLFKPLNGLRKAHTADEQERWRSITKIEILKVEDTHG